MDTREEVLKKVSRGGTIISVKKSVARIDNKTIHYRYKSHPSDSSGHFPFNINPTTLAADFEIWICGNDNLYYLIPKKFVKKIYDDPDTYTNNTENQSQIKTLTVDTFRNVAKYGRNGKQLDLLEFKNKTLRDFIVQ